MQVRPGAPRPPVRSAVSAAIIAALAVPAAMAGPRAPIRYADEAAARPSAAPAAAIAETSADKTRRRIEFRYPDQPSVFYGEQGARAADSAAAPIVFSSAEAAIAPEDARRIARTAPIEPAALAPVTKPLVPAAQPASQPAALAVRPAAAEPFVETGLAIIYEEVFAGLATANGETYDPQGMTAAHPTLPLPSLVHVTNLATGQEVILRVNDRGPFEEGAALQVSQRAASVLGFAGQSRASVSVRYLSEAPPVSAAPVKADTPAKVVLRPGAAPVPVKPAGQGDELLGGGARPALAPAPTFTHRAAVSAEPSLAASGGLYVQLASFSDAGNAEALHRKLRGDLPVDVVAADVGGRTFFRVRVGPYASRDVAESMRDLLETKGLGAGRVVAAP